MLLIFTLQVASNDNDGVRLFESLLHLQSPEDIPQLLGSIEGPYAFAFYHVRSSTSQ